MFLDFETLIFVRENNDLKQKDVAKILNVKQSNISNWEKIKKLFH